MGKKKILGEEIIHDIVLQSANDVLCLTGKRLGFDRVLVTCQDGPECLCLLRGKIERIVWISEGDMVLVSPRDFQADTGGDVVRRYTGGQLIG